MSPIRVLICDDHPMVRQGLRSFLELHEQIEVIGEAANGKEALEAIATTNPDVVLLDLVMPQMDGLDVLKQLPQPPARPKILVLSSFIDDERVFAAIEIGADGYLLKEISPSELLQAIQLVMQGQSPLHPAISQKLMKRLSQPHKSASIEDLTLREQEILQLVAQGMKNRAIAQELHISEKTVKTHVSNILFKLALPDRVQLVVWAHKHHLFQPPNL
ncbi:MAG: response regulator transcription factor [Myxococcales bacterium]|nr:response regulator transcription factor [Myxococcales bacterium]